jgi:hypothetical protein
MLRLRLKRRWTSFIPLGRLAEPEEFANAIVPNEY